MIARQSPHARAVLQAFFVTFLWSTSWVLIKIGLKDIPALTFAGLRYALAFGVLWAAAWQSGQLGALRRLNARDWRRLIVLGVLFYAVTQGSQFLALERLPAVTVSLLLSFTAAIVALLGAALLREIPTRAQWVGIAIYLVGAVIYFTPIAIPTREVIGLLIVLAGVFSGAFSTVLGRAINRDQTITPLLITTVSMGIGAAIMLVGGVTAQGLPAFGVQGWAIIVWLAVVNTAFAFTLWNHTQRTLSAIETSVINNTMLIQIAVLAWVFLGESLTARAIVGLALAAIGTLIVQVKRRA